MTLKQIKETETIKNADHFDFKVLQIDINKQILKTTLQDVKKKNPTALI